MQSHAHADAPYAVSTALLAELRSRIPAGRVLTNGPEYAKAVALFNAAVDVRPAVVVRCATTADVQAAIRASRNHGVPISVRGGGHDFWGRAFRPGGLVLDLTDMRGVQVDIGRRFATVGGGALSSDVVSAAERAGLTAVTGTAGAVGMVGLTLGGGYGPLIGQFGLAADNLLGAEVVLADGSRVHTDADHHPDLFWALRGGGGNFGVVTSARIRLHPVPTVVSGTILYPIVQSADVLADLGGILRDCPDELTVDVGLLPGPDGKPTVYVAPTWSGTSRWGTPRTGRCVPWPDSVHPCWPRLDRPPVPRRWPRRTPCSHPGGWARFARAPSRASPAPSRPSWTGLPRSSPHRSPRSCGISSMVPPPVCPRLDGFRPTRTAPDGRADLIVGGRKQGQRRSRRW